MSLCQHLAAAKPHHANTTGCEECMKMDSWWVHLRTCLTCGHVGCCDSSPNKHATKHFHTTHHPVMQSHEPGEHWRFCYVDEQMAD